jgi:hypothetical protein
LAIGHQAKFLSEHDCLSPAGNAELAVELAVVPLDGIEAQEKFVGDLLI